MDQIKPIPWRRTARPGWIALTLLALASAGCSFEEDFPVRATVLEIQGTAMASRGAGSSPVQADLRLEPGQGVRTGDAPDSLVAVELVPGTLAALRPNTEVGFEDLRLTKHGLRMRGRRVGLRLDAGTLDLLINAPEGAAETTLRVRTPAGEILLVPGCLVRVTVQAPPGVTLLCARGVATWNGRVVPAGSVGELGLPKTHGGPAGESPPPALRPIAASAGAQTALLEVLEEGAHLQGLGLRRQTLPPSWWRPPAPP